MTPTIRIADEADIPSIFAVRTSVRENHISLERLAEMGITRHTIAEALRAEPCIWVAEVDAAVVGFSMADKAEACVFALFMHPDWEGQGIGSLLMAPAESYLFETHPLIWLGTDSSTRAAGFYEKRGWIRTHVMPSGDTRFEKHRS